MGILDSIKNKLNEMEKTNEEYLNKLNNANIINNLQEIPILEEKKYISSYTNIKKSKYNRR